MRMPGDVEILLLYRGGPIDDVAIEEDVVSFSLSAEVERAGAVIHHPTIEGSMGRVK